MIFRGFVPFCFFVFSCCLRSSADALFAVTHPPIVLDIELREKKELSWSRCRRCDVHFFSGRNMFCLLSKRGKNHGKKNVYSEFGDCRKSRKIDVSNFESGEERK